MEGPSILVAGEALIDLLPAGGGRGEGRGASPEGRLEFRAVPGGSPFNVAFALGRLGVPVRFVCPFSHDPFGELLFRTQQESGVDLSWAPRTSALSTLGFAAVDPVTGAARYSFYTEGTAGCGLRPEDVPQPLPEDVAALHVGSFSLAIDPFGSTVAGLVEREAGRRLISLDPNIRPFLLRDRASFWPRWERLLARASLVKLSEEDLAWLYPGGSAEAVLGELLDAGPELVVLTRGADGVVGRTRTLSVSVPACRVTLVDTVGAGDTFQAALLAGLRAQRRLAPGRLGDLSEADLKILLEFASRAAAVTCSRAGCNPPRLSEL